MTEKPIMPY